MKAASPRAIEAVGSLSMSPTSATCTSPTPRNNNTLKLNNQSSGSTCASTDTAVEVMMLTPTTSRSGGAPGMGLPNRSHSQQSTLHEEAMAAHHKYNAMSTQMQMLAQSRLALHRGRSWNQMQRHRSTLPLSRPRTPVFHNQCMPRPRSATVEALAPGRFGTQPLQQPRAQMQTQMPRNSWHGGIGGQAAYASTHGVPVPPPPLRPQGQQVQVRVQASRVNGPNHAADLSTVTVTTINTADFETDSEKTNSPPSSSSPGTSSSSSVSTPTETEDREEDEMDAEVEQAKPRMQRVYTDSEAMDARGTRAEIATFLPNVCGDEREESYKL